MNGRTIGHYEVLEKLGEGGMGVVYKARDVRLNRFVALKLLSSYKVADEDRLRRFTQEAHTASALNHPNIVTIHDIGTEGGAAYIVMEYVVGKTLDQLIPRKGMRLAEVLKIAVQAADGLAAAAAAGVIHRDVKPGNVMVTDSGLVKVLDFGLAKLAERAASPEQATATIMDAERPRTREGTIIGTVSYMSPEQAEGKPLDPRSDIFSFGAVLYEMVTGQRAFRGETSMSTISSILRDNPKSVAELSGDVPRDLEKIIARCLRKDPERRFQHMSDVRVALLELKEESESGRIPAPVAASRKPRRVWPYAVTAGVVVAAGLVFALRTRGGAPVPDAALRAVPVTSYSGPQGAPTFSPDGNQIAFPWNGDQGDVTHIYVKLIGTDTPLQLTFAKESDSAPAWAPNGKSIAFLRRGGIYSISPIRGAERRIAELGVANGMRLNWSQDSKWLVASGREAPGQPSRVFAISVESGDKRPLALGGAADIFAPALSPDSRQLAFLRVSADSLYELDSVELDEHLQPRGDPRKLPTPPTASPNTSVAWTTDSQRILFAGGGLWMVSAAGKAPARELALSADRLSFPAVSPQGNRLALQRTYNDVNVWRIAISGPAKVGEASAFLVSPHTDRAVEHSYSPDQRKVAFESNRSGSTSVWVADADGSNPTLLYGGAGYLSGSPSWSPDSRWIAFDTRKDNNAEIYVISADGGAPRRLTDHPADDVVPCWSHDGEWIYFTSNRSGSFEIFKMRAAGGEATQITHHGAWTPHASPDGKFLYYTRYRTGMLLSTAEPSPLLRVRVEGGEETQILDSVYPREWTLAPNGIWYMTPIGPSQSELRFFDATSGKTNVAATIAKPVIIGLSISPDARYLLYNQNDHAGTEILLVENFR